MGQQTSSSQPPLNQRPPPSRRTSSNIVRSQRKRSLELPEFAALTLSSANGLPLPSTHQLPPPSSAIPIPMAATVFSQPPSPPHSKAHYFPPSSAMIHHPPPRPHYTPPVVHQEPQHPQPPPQPQPQRQRPQQARPSVVKDDVLLVRSRLPTGLPSPAASGPSAQDEDDQPEGTQEATITWRGSAKEVYLTGISDSDRPYRVKMVHE